MQYADYVVELTQLMPTTIADPVFQSILPRCIEYAEERCYGDLDLLATRITDGNAALSANSRIFTLPTDMGTFIVVEQVNVFDPAGFRNPLTPVAREFLDAVWPTDTAPTTPSMPTIFCMRDNANIMVGPAPDSNYTVEVVGTIRPTPLSATNPMTPLTSYVPQLFVAASMVFMSGKMHEFTSMGDDPQMGVTWENQYGKMLTPILVEQWRAKYQSQGWHTRLPSAIATPAQT